MKEHTCVSCFITVLIRTHSVRMAAAKTKFSTTLANVDFLHGPAESLLTITNLLIGDPPPAMSYLYSGMDVMMVHRITAHAERILRCICSVGVPEGNYPGRECRGS